jgi:O-antigen/teichoic acid export membrane protein
VPLLATTGSVAGAALTCLYAAVLYVLREDLTAYIFGYATIAAITNAALQITGLIVAKRAGIPITFGRLNESWRTSGWEMLSFSWATSLTGTAYVLRENVPLLAVGAFLGPAAAGLFHVASRLAGILSMATWAMSQSLYAEAAHVAASKRYADLTWLVVRTSVYLGALGLAALLSAMIGGPALLALLAGEQYIAASAALSLLIAAQGLSGVNVGLRGALPLTAGPTKLLMANVMGLIVFAITLITFTPWLGAPGAALAQLAFELTALAVSAWYYRRWLQPL